MTTETIEPPRVFPTFQFRDPERMIAWLCDAFGFTVHVKYTDPSGGVAHAELAFGASMIMVGQSRDDEFGRLVGDPGSGNGTAIYIAVPDVTAVYERARAAGATIEQELRDRDYGSREFICRDPEGGIWCIGTYWPKAHEPAHEAETA